MKKKVKQKKGRLLIRTGLLLIVAAVALCGYNVYDSMRAGRAAQESVLYLEELIAPVQKQSVTGQPVQLVQQAPTFEMIQTPVEMPVVQDVPQETELPVVVDVPQEVEIPDYILNPNMEMPVSKYKGYDYIGILEIPAIELKIPVISKWNYARLRVAPCRYSGSVYTNNMVVSAHNYASHFGSLNKLYEGAAVRFTDIDGNVFNYRVGMKETLNPKDVEYMKDGGWDLTLFTCTPGGSYRVTVRCERVRT